MDPWIILTISFSTGCTRPRPGFAFYNSSKAAVSVRTSFDFDCIWITGQIILGRDQNNGIGICAHHSIQLHRTCSRQYIDVGTRTFMVSSNYLPMKVKSKHRQWTRLAGSTTKDRGFAPNEASNSTRGHSRRCVVSCYRSKLFCDWDYSRGRWRTRSLVELTPMIGLRLIPLGIGIPRGVGIELGHFTQYI